MTVCIPNSKEKVQAFPYSFELLLKLLAHFLCESNELPEGEDADSIERVLQNKLHLTYFREYFGYFAEKGPLSVVAEWQYTDRDYLDDYAAFYVRCFQGKYLSWCARLHFFQGSIDTEDLRKGDTKDAIVAQDFNDRYLGFVVIRPLVHAPIGRTCLRTYDDDDRRFYPVTRRCDAHLCGIDLQVNSLAFQEQDKVVAACATSSLWSALHGTAMLFQHRVFSPVEITRIATEQFPGLRRAFPNIGLTPIQMAASIRQAGLEPEVVGVDRKATLQATAYAYLQAGIPLLLNVALFDVSDPMNPIPFRGAWEIGHAVAITGFSLGSADLQTFPGTGTMLRSSRIDKLYVHDDQVGPFARLTFAGPSLVVSHAGLTRKIDFTMTSSWCGRLGQTGSVLFAPKALIIPVYHKIRVDFDTILQEVLRLDAKSRHLAEERGKSIAPIEWDIFLTTEAKMKSDVRSDRSIPDDKKWEILSRSFPRFLWRATACFKSFRYFEFVFDATDAPGGNRLQIMNFEHEPGL